MSGTASLQLVCPKCQGSMRSYERNGVTIDQCGDCRGIFLDRGELERLVDAENAHYRQPESRESRDSESPLGGFFGRGSDDDDDDDDDRRHGGSRGRGQKRGGFLSDLFDS